MQKLKYCYQVVAGVAYLHSRDVIHRDMKPENVLYDEEKDQMVIGDLGLGKALACSYRDIGISDFAFTLWYRPPELLLGGTYYYPGDVWSVGLVIYYILTGRDLFKGNKSTDMVLAIIKVLGGPTPESWDLVKALTSKSISGLTYSDLSIQTILKSYAGQVGNPSKIISLDTEMFEWSSLFLMTLQLNPANRASIFELLAAPIFNPVRDISLESSYINCLDNLYLRSAPMVLYAETVVKGERDFQDRFEQNINLTRNSRTDLLSWLLDVSRNFYLRRETYFMTVNLIDRYLPLSLMTQELPSFGLACLHIAVGHYEEYFFDTPLEELAVVGGDLVSIESIQSAAIEVLKRSKYDLLSATAIDFLREFYKSVLEKEADKAKIGKVYRISQGLLYASLFWENVLIYDAPRLALWSWNMASRYWNLTNPSSSISMYYDSLLPADNDISITDAMDIEGGNRIPGLVPDEVTRYFSAPVNGALDLPRIIAALAVSN